MVVRLLTWQQKHVLRAAAAVDYLECRSVRQIVGIEGVLRSLVIRGLLFPHSRGWEIAPDIRMKWKNDRNYSDDCYGNPIRRPSVAAVREAGPIIIKTTRNRKEITNMARPRYYVHQGYGDTNVWRLLDRQTKKELGMFPTRAEARLAAATLNKLERRDHVPAPEQDAVVPGEAI